MTLRVKRHRLPHAAAWLTGLTCAAGLLLGGCGTVRPPAAAAPDAAGQPATRAAPGTATAPARTAGNAPVLPPAGSGRGGYYLDDGPGDAPPPNLDAVPDAEPKIEPYSVRGNKPYVVFGKTYVPVTDNQPMKQRGIGSWYGKKFHGQKTSSGELYDMYKMTAAHPTLPIPSYARVTNLKNGAQVIVRVNDRGPFHSSRIIDLSYTAALKLGYIGHGSSELEVERLLPDEIARINAQSRNRTVAAVTPLPPRASVSVPAAAPIPVPAPAAVPAPIPVASATVPADMPATDRTALDDFLKMQTVDAAMPASSTPTMLPTVNAAMPDTPSTTQAALSQPSMSQPASARPAEADAVLAAGVYLQFGAYTRSAHADQLRQQLMQRWPAGMPLPEVRQSGNLYRLFSGPYANREAAALAASQLGERPAARPLIVTR